jgi:hypothetical protein
MVTLLNFGFAVLLFVLADEQVDARILLLRWVAALWLLATIVTIATSRRRPSDLLRVPVVVPFVAVAVLCLAAAR